MEEREFNRSPGCILRMAMKDLIIFLIALAIGSLFPVSSSAQWNLQLRYDSSGDFDFNVIYFLDLPGPPRIGFAGSGGGIWKTTNGGASWRQTLFFAPDGAGFSDFAFKDTLTGWCACSEYELLYRTTDGGDTWSFVSLPNDFESSIYYDEKNGGLFTSGINGGLVSWDEGATWQSQPSTGGFAFSNNDSGIAAGWDYEWQRTTNGGQS